MVAALIPQADIDREFVRRRGLHEFVRRAWSQVEAVQFRDNWHIGVICEHLEACYNRQIRKIVITIPPGCMKSLTVSVFYPIWCWLQEPKEKFIFSSYDSGLSERDAKRMRDVVTSQWFKERWGDVVGIPAKSLRQVRNFQNDKLGFRFSTSVGGPMTGRHANQLWVDDPIKPKDTQGGADQTRKKLDECVSWYRATLSTRQSNPETTVKGLMMQRLHDVDLAGVLLAEGGWEHLMLPMRYEPKRSCVTVLGSVDRRTEEGELLWPKRFTEEAVKELENTLLDYASAQLQQNPVPATGGTFKAEWFKQFWSFDGTIPGTIPLPKVRDMACVQSWDMAFKGKNSSDPVCGQAWGRQMARFFLLDQTLGRRTFGESKEELKRFSARHPQILTKLVEDKANGSAILDDLRHEVVGLEGVDPEGGKEARAHVSAALYRAGNVWLPHPSMPGFEWVNHFIQEHLRFPKGINDDQVDAESQALHYLNTGVPRLLEAMQRVRAERTSPAPPPAVVLKDEPPPRSPGPSEFADFQRSLLGTAGPQNPNQSVDEGGDSR